MIGGVGGVSEGGCRGFTAAAFCLSVRDLVAFIEMKRIFRLRSCGRTIVLVAVIAAVRAKVVDR